MSTDEIDQITPEERSSMVGFCEKCALWHHFQVGEGKLPYQMACPVCRSGFSHRHGLQITTERSFNMTLAKKKVKR